MADHEPSHLSALNLRLSNERMRLAAATNESERRLRQVWIAQIEKEIADEEACDFSEFTGSDDELLALLTEPV